MPGRSPSALLPLAGKVPNVLVRGNPFGASRPASARLPRQSDSCATVRPLPEEGARGHVAVAGRPFREIAELRLRQLGELQHVDAGDTGAAGVGLQEACEHLHGGGLSGAIGAQEPQHLALPDSERDAVDGDDLAETFLQIGSFDQDRH